MNDSEKWTIVLIDDEEDIREVLALTLMDAGYLVFTAPDGETGLRVCAEQNPQIVVTDIRMPRMDGLRVLELLKKSRPETEVIVATAFGEMDLAIQALRLDASDFIAKPIGDEALHLALKRARERYSSRKQLADYTVLLEEENVRTTRELVRTLAFQRNLIESSMDGILGCDRSGKAVAFNKALEALLGFSKEEVLGRKALSDFFSPEDLQALKDALASEKFGKKGRLFIYETRAGTKDGGEVPVQVSAAEILDHGEKDGLVLFIRDLGEIRRLERETADQVKILHQDKMMSLGRLAAGVVHEINNPLAGILNYSRLMLKILEKGAPAGDRLEKFKDYLTLIESETGRCSRIVSSLLSFSRRSEPLLAEVDLNKLLETSIILSGHKLILQNIAVHLNLCPAPLQVVGDANQLQQCLINLIFNAIDAMPEGGMIILEAGPNPATGGATISVKDTGAGISPQDLPHIFEPFFTTKKQGFGVGLGLSTVYGIIEDHHGTVEVKTAPGKGTAFIINLPEKQPG
ncbi:MAG: response regulator [Pseudomonadota bacterium]